MQITIMNVKSIVTEKFDRGGVGNIPPYEAVDILITDEKNQEHLIHMLADPGTFATKAPELDNTELNAAYQRGLADGLRRAYDKMAEALGLEAEV